MLACKVLKPYLVPFVTLSVVMRIALCVGVKLEIAAHGCETMASLAKASRI